MRLRRRKNFLFKLRPGLGFSLDLGLTLGLDLFLALASRSGHRSGPGALGLLAAQELDDLRHSTWKGSCTVNGSPVPLGPSRHTAGPENVAQTTAQEQTQMSP